MSEKTVSQTKNRIAVFILSFVLIILKGCHGAGLRGMVQLDVFAALVAGSFAYSFIMSMNIPADGKILSVQNLLAVLSAGGLILGVFNYKEMNVELFAMLAVFAGGLLFVKEIRYLPAAAALSILSYSFLQFTTISAIPMLFAAGFVLNWHKVKKASIVDKIIFGVSEAVLFVIGAYCFKIFKDSFTWDSFKAYWVYSLATILMAALALFVAFKAFKAKNGKIEALGYLCAAAAALSQTSMNSRNAYMVIAALGLTLIVMASGETFAKKTFNEINETVANKLCK